MKKYNKFISILFLVLGTCGLLFLFNHVIAFNKHVVNDMDFYYPLYTENNLNGWNFFDYFTFLSNTLCDIYLILLGVYGLGCNKLNKIVNNSYVQGMLTVYIIVTGLVYCIVLGPNMKMYPWEGPMAIGNIVSYWNHIVMPIFMVVLWFFPKTSQTLNKNFKWMVLVFPAFYCLCSIIRGLVSKHGWLPYPFFDPVILWKYLFKDKPFEIFPGICVFVGFLSLLLVLFIGISVVLKYFRNKQLIKK